MRFTRFSVAGFMAIGSATLDLNDKGLVLIQGENLDDASAKSNGAGKSSIPDALSWCLFGVTARGEAGDAIINNNAKYALTSVQIDVDEDHQYVVSRFRKHPKYKNQVHVARIVDGDTVDLTAGTSKATQELINKIIGCDHTVFNAAIYQGQEKMPNLPTYTDKQLKELVEETAGINILQDCYIKARDKRRGAETILKSCDERLGIVEEALEKCKHDLKVVKTRSHAWQADRDGRVAAKKATYDEKGLEWEAARKRLDSAEEHREKIEDNIKTLKKTLKRRDDMEQDLKRLVAEVAEKKSALLLEEKTVEGQETVLNDKARSLEHVEERVGTPCSKCGKPIEEEDLVSVIERLKNEIVEATVNLRESKSARDKAEERYLKAQKIVDEFEASIPDYSEAADKLAKCREVISKIDSMASTVDLLWASLQEAEAIWKEAKSEKNPHLEAQETLVTDIADYKKSVKKHKKDYEAAVVETRLYDKAVEVFAPAGVRAHILDHVTPFLNARTSHYLSTLSDGNLSAIWTTLSTTAKGELREKFSIEVTNEKGGKSFGLLSGGEKRKVRLACAMALQDVVSQRATKPIDLFMADEIDDALDEAGLERLMAILDEKARERGTVLVVSHNNLNDWIREVSTVRKKGGEATISGALCA